MSGLPLSTQKEMEKFAIAALKKRADEKLLPYLKENLRRDSGAMVDNTDAEVIEDQGRLKLEVVIGRGLNYPQFVEGRIGVLKGGVKAGAVAEELVKSLLD